MDLFSGYSAVAYARFDQLSGRARQIVGRHFMGGDSFRWLQP